MIALPEEFTARMREELGESFGAFLCSYEQPPVRGLRVNTRKLTPEAFCARSPWTLGKTELPEGFILRGDTAGIGEHPYHRAGLFYIQEPAAMLASAALEVRPGMRVLDLCAAPGGKAGAIAGRLAGAGLLVANEVVSGRARTLVQNLQRLGVINAVVTCAAPEALAQALPDYFDAVLLDAPCSGEGMFRKDEAARREWSIEHVHACALRQRGILESAARCLCPGGRLVYSTCTFSREENEEVLADFLRAHDDFSLLNARRLYPHEYPCEGHFIACLARSGAGGTGQSPFTLPRADLRAYADFAADTFAEPLPGTPCLLGDGRVFLLPSMPAPLRALRMLAAGVEAGELVKGRFVPAHALFMAHGEKCAQKLRYAPEDAALRAFLRGETPATTLRGFAAVCVEDWPLGYGKGDGRVLKNHLPKGLRSLR